jgi:RimJ/RimL family protein N-acetyltransferase
MTAAAGVRLRPYERDDLAAFAALLGDPEVMRYADGGAPLAPGAASELFDKAFVLYATDPSFHIWAVDEDGAYAGHAELKRRAGRGEYELIYFLQRARWGRGLGGRVVDAILAVARAERLPFVIATVDAANAASLRLLERRGFRHDPALSATFACPALRLELEAQP